MSAFQDKSVVVVGSARGIGLELVHQLSAEPTNTVLALDTYLSPELEQLIEGRGNVRFKPADICDPAPVKAASEGLDRVDLLLCVAGVLGSQQPLLTRSKSEPDPLIDIQQVFAVNLFGTWNAVSAFQDKMGMGGKIMLMSSSNGSMETATAAQNPAYSMSKAAINMLGRKLSVELKDRGVDVVLMSPGIVKTQMTKGQGEITPEESVKGILTQLAREGTTGQFLRYDGNGWPW